MRILMFLATFGLLTHCAMAQKGFNLKTDVANKKVSVLFNGKLLTAYCYFDSTEKPVLFPVKTLSGITVTRGYPVAPREGERTDHPHHLGIWLNYESVNGLDFWNNSTAIAKEKLDHYGSIRHQKILSSSGKGDRANLSTSSQWVDHSGNVLVNEVTDFQFSVSGSDFIIDRTSTLTGATDVEFKDVKDGMLAIRVSRALEMPSKEAGSFVDAHGQVTKVPAMDNSQVTGLYVNREGVQGDSVWGKRSEWAMLKGKEGGKDVAIIIIDHPSNPGYPTYWHARGYGLFAANPLGQKVFSKGKEELDLKLKKGEKVSFKYRIVIHEGSVDAKQTDALMNAFAKK
ncbi:MAG: PmoA family protein [Chryseolinea sp.]